jgi:hypothetical protein
MTGKFLSAAAHKNAVSHYTSLNFLFSLFGLQMVKETPYRNGVPYKVVNFSEIIS